MNIKSKLIYLAVRERKSFHRALYCITHVIAIHQFHSAKPLHSWNFHSKHVDCIINGKTLCSVRAVFHHDFIWIQTLPQRQQHFLANVTLYIFCNIDEEILKLPIKCFASLNWIFDCEKLFLVKITQKVRANPMERFSKIIQVTFTCSTVEILEKAIKNVIDVVLVLFC